MPVPRHLLNSKCCLILALLRDLHACSNTLSSDYSDPCLTRVSSVLQQDVILRPSAWHIRANSTGHRGPLGFDLFPIHGVILSGHGSNKSDQGPITSGGPQIV